jgi:hypothetical protein
MKSIQRGSRRNFLLAASLGAAGVVAAAATVRGPAAAGGAVATAPVEASGYRASPHVLKYYKTIEF